MFGKIAEAFEVTGLDPVSKFVLVAMANRASRAGECWASSLLVADTGYSLATIKRARERLAAIGAIVDTGKRRGRTGRAVVWQVLPNGVALTPLEAGCNGVALIGNGVTLHGNGVTLIPDPVHDPVTNPSPGALRAREGDSSEVTDAQREAVTLDFQGGTLARLTMTADGRCVTLDARKRNGDKAIAKAQREDECWECQHAVQIGDSIFFDPENGRVRHQVCRESFDNLDKVYHDVMYVDRVDACCHLCGERFKRDDMVSRYFEADDRDRLIPNPDAPLMHVKCDRRADAYIRKQLAIERTDG